jgi:hypothetical protein
MFPQPGKLEETMETGEVEQLESVNWAMVHHDPLDVVIQTALSTPNTSTKAVASDFIFGNVRCAANGRHFRRSKKSIRQAHVLTMYVIGAIKWALYYQAGHLVRDKNS